MLIYSILRIIEFKR